MLGCWEMDFLTSKYSTIFVNIQIKEKHEIWTSGELLYELRVLVAKPENPT